MRKIFVFSICLATLAMAVAFGVYQKQLRSRPLVAQSLSDNDFSKPRLPMRYRKIEKCFPTTHEFPETAYITTYQQKDYFWVFAPYKKSPETISSLPNPSDSLLFSSDIKGCKKLEKYNSTIAPLESFIPHPAAVELKSQYWSATRKNMTKQEFEQLLDTKPEAPDPFFLFLEDVEALKKIGLTPTKNVFIVRDENDLTKLFEQIRRP